MARITVEDCLENVDNRFDLVLLATKRARQINHGVEPLVERANDKSTVIALREIAEGLVSNETVVEAEQEQESIDQELAAALQAEDFDLGDMANGDI